MKRLQVLDMYRGHVLFWFHFQDIHNMCTILQVDSTLLTYCSGGFSETKEMVGSGTLSSTTKLNTDILWKYIHVIYILKALSIKYNNYINEVPTINIGAWLGAGNWNILLLSICMIKWILITKFYTDFVFNVYIINLKSLRIWVKTQLGRQCQCIVRTTEQYNYHN